MAVILIGELLHTHPDGVLATWHQNLVSLRELRLEQAIKRIRNLNLKWAAILTRVSHAFLGRAEMHLMRWLRSLQWSGHCFLRISAAVPRFAVEASR
jgi:hypothetical protein